MDENRCQFIKQDGAQCRASKVHGSDLCFFHDPAKAAERMAAQSAGGRNGRAAVLPSDTPHFPIKTASDVIDLLGETINQVRTGMLDPRVGNCLGYLSGIVLKAVEQGDLEERLAALESIVTRQAPPRDLFDADPAELAIGGERQAEPERASA